MTSSRQISKSQSRGITDIQEALATLLSAELVLPSETLFVHSAWITDVPVLDNSAGTFSLGSDAWEERWIYLSEVLVALMRRGTQVRLKTNTSPHNDAFRERLRSRAAMAGVEDRLETLEDPEMHSKGLIGDMFAVRGSMNFTYLGLEKKQETIDIDVDNTDVANLRLDVTAEWTEDSQ